MFIETVKVLKQYTRISKLGKEHVYQRTQTQAVFICDNCGVKFIRLLSKMSSKRLSNNYFHCCSDCNVKQFAQRKGVEKKRIWELPASSTKNIGQI